MSASDIISTNVRTISKFSKWMKPSSVADLEKLEAFVTTRVHF